MSHEFETAPARETLRRQIADDHGFTLYRHYSERDAAAFLRLHPVTLKKIRLAGLDRLYLQGPPRRRLFRLPDRRLSHRSGQTMPRYTKHRFQIGEWWLSQRSGSPAWYATFYDQAAKRTRRVSLGTDDFEQARQRLLERYLEEAPAAERACRDGRPRRYRARLFQERMAAQARSCRRRCGLRAATGSISSATRPFSRRPGRCQT